MRATRTPVSGHRPSKSRRICATECDPLSLPGGLERTRRRRKPPARRGRVWAGRPRAAERTRRPSARTVAGSERAQGTSSPAPRREAAQNRGAGAAPPLRTPHFNCTEAPSGTHQRPHRQQSEPRASAPPLPPPSRPRRAQGVSSGGSGKSRPSGRAPGLARHTCCRKPAPRGATPPRGRTSVRPRRPLPAGPEAANRPPLGTAAFETTGPARQTAGVSPAPRRSRAGGPFRGRRASSDPFPLR